MRVQDRSWTIHHDSIDSHQWMCALSLFAWIINHQPAVLFSQNKPATSQQYFSLSTNQHQTPATSQTNRLSQHATCALTDARRWRPRMPPLQLPLATLGTSSMPACASDDLPAGARVKLLDITHYHTQRPHTRFETFYVYQHVQLQNIRSAHAYTSLLGYIRYLASSFILEALLQLLILNVIRGWSSETMGLFGRTSSHYDSIWELIL
jgi:hypothetical protein